jgi:ATP-dependent Lhr-like helicase
LQRHGVLTREAVLAEGWTGGFAALYPVLRAMEEAGRIRRGYFIEGLGGSQFALPGAVDRLRASRDEKASIVVLAAADPANSYGAVLPWPREGGSGEGRMARVAGAYVVLDGGEPRLFLERGARSLLTRGDVNQRHLEALGTIAERAGRLELQRVDGVPIHESPLAALLKAAGFGSTPRGMIRYAGS